LRCSTCTGESAAVAGGLQARRNTIAARNALMLGPILQCLQAGSAHANMEARVGAKALLTTGQAIQLASSGL